MKRFFGILLSLVLTLAVGFSFAGCKDKVDPNSTVVKEIKMWAGGQWTGSDYTNLKSFIDGYNKAAPHGFKVKLESKADLEVSFAGAITDGTQPDIMIWDRFNTPTSALGNELRSVKAKIAKDNVDTSLFHSEAMKEMTYNDDVYGLPLDVDLWGVYVNLDLVDKYNVKPENAASQIVLNDNWTWDEMLEIAKKLKTVCAAGYSSGDQEQHLFKYGVSAGTDLVKDGAANFDTAECREILKYFKKVKEANVGGKQEKMSFVVEDLAMVNNPIYYASYVKKNAPNLNFKFMPQPRYSIDGAAQDSGVNGGMIGGYGIAFPAAKPKYDTIQVKARHDAAWEFTKWWLLSEEKMIEWSQKSGTLPALISTHDDAKITSNPTLSAAANYLTKYKIRPQIKGYLNLQVNVINPLVKNFLEGTSLESTISSLTTSGNAELKK